MTTPTHVKKAAEELVDKLGVGTPGYIIIKDWLLKHLPQPSEWVDVRDRLPEVGFDVLVCTTAAPENVAFQDPKWRETFQAYVDEIGLWHDLTSENNRIIPATSWIVTYWMPLPLPPSPQPPEQKEKV